MTSRSALCVALALSLVGAGLAACGGGGGSGSGAAERVVLVDYQSDEFATSMIDFFPERVEVHPGDTVRFEQAWTGEPHSVTFGAPFNEALGRIRARLGAAPTPAARPRAEDLPDLAAFDGLPVMLGRAGDEFAVNQNGAQPCYLDSGAPPTDPDTPCPRRTQPEFTGRHTYYSSGFIPYDGPSGNEFQVRLADDIAPGSYHFYCNLHGVGQSGTIVVVDADEPIPAAIDVRRAARRTIEERYETAMRDALGRAVDGGPVTVAKTTVRSPLAGVATDEVRPWGGLAHQRHFDHRHGSVNEFVPRVVRARPGEAVTWTFVGRHTVSVDVPDYLPIFRVLAGGEVVLDPRVHEPVGWPAPPPRPEAGTPVHLDAGRWDGTGFRSTGLAWETGDRFTVRFTKAGTYPIACLIHPRMVGEVVVG